MRCGLTNAPAPFQRFMSEVFKDVCVVVYLDDILIYSDNQMSTSSMYARSSNAFMQAPYAPKSRSALSVWDTTDYLGFIIGSDGLRMDTPKIQVITDCLAPEKVRMSNRSWVSPTFTYGLSPRAPISPSH